MTFEDFRSGPVARQRYWARAHIGWQRMTNAQPNAAHRCLVRLQSAGQLSGLITQNVDGLHGQAGHAGVIDLHGRLDQIICLDCGARTTRSDLQDRLSRMNPGHAERVVNLAPDGDAELEDTAGFRVADCKRCGGVLKPDVVFFGENVPKNRVNRCIELVDAAGSLVVFGSSLQVMSGLRFVRQAHKRGIPIVIVNRGATRGDDLATLKLEAGCAETLTALERATII